jgi:hypothetical protein
MWQERYGNVPAPTTRTLGLGAAEVVAYRAILGREREIDIVTGGVQLMRWVRLITYTYLFCGPFQKVGNHAIKDSPGSPLSCFPPITAARRSNRCYLLQTR